MAAGHHLCHLGVFLGKLLDNPHQLGLLLEIVARLCQHHHVTSVAHPLECLQRYGVNHAAVKQHTAVNLHRARHCGHGTGGAHPLQLMVRELPHLVIHRLTCKYIGGDEPEVHRVLAERLAVKGVYLKRHHMIGELRPHDVAGLYKTAQPHVPRVLAQLHVIPEGAAFLP